MRPGHISDFVTHTVSPALCCSGVLPECLTCRSVIAQVPPEANPSRSLDALLLDLWGLQVAQQAAKPAASKASNPDAAQTLSIAERFRMAYEQRDQQQAEKTVKVGFASVCICLQDTAAPPLRSLSSDSRVPNCRRSDKLRAMRHRGSDELSARLARRRSKSSGCYVRTGNNPAKICSDLAE